jgi:hypothetical protein
VSSLADPSRRGQNKNSLVHSPSLSGCSCRSGVRTPL